MYCRNCGKEIQDNAMVCINCGVKAGTGNNFCKNCGAETAPSAIVCVKCGCALKSSATTNSADSFIGAIKTCFNKYATFEGRAGRSEYWFWYLFTLIVGLAIGWIPVLGWIVSLATIIPSLAVFVRRMHDIGRSGFWFFIGLIPIIGWIWIILLLCQPSQEGENEYGAKA